MAQKIKK